MSFSYILARIVFSTFYRVGFQWRICNPERIPLQGPFILAANHASYLDPPLVGAASPRDIHYMAKESLFRFAPMRMALRSLNVIPVNRDGGGGAGLKAIFERLDQGNGIILFPEGTRTPDGQLQPARSGIGLLVIKTTAPVIPVRVFGTYEAFGRHRRFPRPHPVVVKFGKPMEFENLRQEAKSCSKPRLKEIYQQVANEIMSSIAELQPNTDVSKF